MSEKVNSVKNDHENDWIFNEVKLFTYFYTHFVATTEIRELKRLDNKQWSIL